MFRFIRLAIAWLAVGGVAVLAVLDLAHSRGSAGSSPVNTPRHDNGKTTPVMAQPARVVPVTPRAIPNRPDEPTAQEPPFELAWSPLPSPTQGILCHAPSVPIAPLLSSNLNVTPPEPLGQPVDVNLSVDPTAASVSTGALNVGLGQTSTSKVDQLAANPAATLVPSGTDHAPECLASP